MVRPLLHLRRKVSSLLGAASTTDKNFNMCVSVRLTAGLAKGLIGCLSTFLRGALPKAIEFLEI